MKCIKTKSGDIKRVEDAAAAQLVNSGEASYVPKSVWKEATRKK